MSDTLICIFQRGGADGLNSLVPYTEESYYSGRPRIAIPPPGEVGGALDLDGVFGAHPAAPGIKALFDAGRLAAVHATGIPHRQRSHFAGQALAEAGVEGGAGSETGWLGRYLSATAAPGDTALRAVSIGQSVPLLLRGGPAPLAIPSLQEFGFGADLPGGYKQTVGQLYSEYAALEVAANATLLGIDELTAGNPARFLPENGARYPQSPLGNALLQAGQLIKAELGTELVCVDSPAWDHHARIGALLPLRMADLSAALLAFDADMGERMRSITVLVQTEFGRTLAANSSDGTDHGTGGVAWLLGGGVNGGQVYADWPGLAPDSLFEGRDLALTTDLRDVIAQLVRRRLRPVDTGAVFPDYVPGVIPDLFL